MKHLVSHRITRRWFAVLLACIITAIAVAGFRTSAFSPAPPVLPGLYYTVTSTADNTDVVIHGGTGTAADPFQMSSVRGAILNANTQITSVVGPITISVPAGTYLLSVSNPDTPAVTGTTSFQDLEVGSGFNQNTTIVGVGGTPRIEQTVSGNDVITTGYADASYTPQAVNLTLQNLEITGGSFSGIFTGVDNGTGLSNTTIVGCNVHDNSDPFGPGGGIFNQTGNLSVQNSTFSNNTASTQGGAIFYDLPNAAGPGSTGTLAVSGSKFSNNQAAAGGGFPAGGAIFIDAAGTGNSISVTNSSFTSNSASGGGSGGAIALVSNNGISVTLSRFAGNMASSGGTAIARQGTGALSAINNWWGCDNFPGSLGCETVSGSAITSPRIDLVVSSGSASICPTQSTSVTASFNQNTPGGAPISPTSLDGATVSFAVSGSGSVAPTSAVISGGVANTTYTAGASPGSANVSGTLDNGTETIAISSNATTTTSDPADQTVCEGGTATFSTTASGANVHYAWTLDGSPFDGDSPSINVPTTGLSYGAHTIGVTVTGTCGTASQSATLTVNQNTSTSDPADATVCQGAIASFSTTATGTGPFSYAWTVDGSPSGGNSNTLNVDTTGLSVGSHTVAVTVTGACNNASQSASLTVQQNTSASDPADQTVCEGATANFSTTASGTNIHYAWTLDGNGIGSDSPSVNVPTTGLSYGAHTVGLTVTGTCGTVNQTATLTVNQNTSASDPADQTVCEGATANFSTTANGADLHYEWRLDGNVIGGDSPSVNVPTTGLSYGSHTVALKVTGACGTVNQTATLIVNQNTSASDPADQTVCEGATANFSTTASGTDIHYEWKLDGNVIGGDSPSVNVPTTGLTYGSHTVALKVTGACGTVNQTATLTVNQNTSTTDPADVLTCEGSTATFSTTASGTGPFSFVWKKGATTLNNGDLGGRVTITNTSTTSTLSISNVGAGDSGSYSVETTGACNTATQSANLTVNSGNPTITLNGQTITLWPPNHNYHTVNVTDLVASASDPCDGSINVNSVVIASVTSDELDDNPGGADGSTINDMVIAADCKSVQLRAERDGNLNGRVYTITFRVTDAHGHVGTATAKVYVPKTQNGGTVIDDGPHNLVTGTCP